MTEIQNLSNEFSVKVARAVCAQLASHSLKKNMSAEDLFELLNLEDMVVLSGEETVEEIEVTKDELPAGISVKRAKELLRILQHGVYEDEYLHVVSGKIVVPTVQQKDFYRNEESRIFGPEKSKEVIEWLAEKVGEVKNPVVKPALPSKWTPQDLKKLKIAVSKCSPDKMVNVVSKREVDVADKTVKNKKTGETVTKPCTMLKNETYNICAPRKDKELFFALVAYLEEHNDDWEAIETEKKKKTTKKAKTAAKAEKPAKGGRKKIVEEEEEETEIDEDMQEEEEKPKRGGRKAKVEEPEEDEDDDEEEDADEEFDFEKLKTKLAKLKEGEYLNVNTGKGVNRTKELEKTHAFHDEAHFCVKKENSDRATKALLAKIRRELTEDE